MGTGHTGEKLCTLRSRHVPGVQGLVHLQSYVWRGGPLQFAKSWPRNPASGLRVGHGVLIYNEDVSDEEGTTVTRYHALPPMVATLNELHREMKGLQKAIEELCNNLAI